MLILKNSHSANLTFTAALWSVPFTIYCYIIKSSSMVQAGLVARMDEMGNLHEILVGKTNGRISLVRGGSL